MPCCRSVLLGHMFYPRHPDCLLQIFRGLWLAHDVFFYDWLVSLYYWGHQAILRLFCFFTSLVVDVVLNGLIRTLFPIQEFLYKTPYFSFVRLETLFKLIKWSSSLAVSFCHKETWQYQIFTFMVHCWVSFNHNPCHIRMNYLAY